VAEQLLYEVGDPQNYLLPDVIADMRDIAITQEGPDRARVSGARGRPPGEYFKACATYDDGWRGVVAFPIRGPEAKAKAERVAAEVLERVSTMLRRRNMPDFRRSLVEILGAEASYGPRARFAESREVILRIAVEHEGKQAIELLFQEQGTGSVSSAPGHVGWTLGTTIMEVARLFSFLVPKSALTASVVMDGVTEMVASPPGGAITPPERDIPPSLPPGLAPRKTLPLLKLAWVRNGDKGDIANIAVIARRPEFLPYLAAALTPEAVRDWYLHHLRDGAQALVERFYVPGIAAFNFLLHGALDGGCTASLRFDPLGKSIAQELLDFPVPVSETITLAASYRSASPA
jgi:hypothetical protein